MKLVLKIIIVVLMLSLVFGVYVQQQVQVEQFGDGKNWMVNICNVDIQVFINQVVEMIGKNFVVDLWVCVCDVIVIFNQLLIFDEVYELFLLVFQVYGYVVVFFGGVIKIVINIIVKQSNLLLIVNVGSVDGEELIIQVIVVDNFLVEELVLVLCLLVLQYGYLVVVGFVNVLIISDYVDNIQCMCVIINSFDNVESDEVEIVQLEYVFVGNMVFLFEELIILDLVVNNWCWGVQGGVIMVVDECINCLIIKGDCGICVCLMLLIQ